MFTLKKSYLSGCQKYWNWGDPITAFVEWHKLHVIENQTMSQIIESGEEASCYNYYVKKA